MSIPISQNEMKSDGLDDDLIIIDEIGSSASVESSDDEVQIICVKSGVSETRQIKEESSRDNSFFETKVVCMESTKRRKVTETHRTAKKAKLTIREPHLDSPDINEDEVQSTLEVYEGYVSSNVSNWRSPKFQNSPTLNEKIWDQIKLYRDKYPKKFAHFDKQILNHYIKNVQNDFTFAWKMQIRKNLLSSINQMYAGANLYVVGSSINGCGSLNSDMDLCCSILNPSYHETDRMSRNFALKTLRKLRSHFIKSSHHLKMQKCILINAKVPILRIHFMGNYKSLEVDLNINNLAGVYNSYLLHYYSRIDDRFPALCLLIKHWAKRNGIAEAMSGTLNSYSLILLVIHFLQVAIKPTILPNLQDCFPELFRDTRPLDECALFQELDKKRYPDPTKNKQTLGELLIAFFDYYCSFDFDNWAISISRACVFPRCELSESEMRFKIFIEEPFDKKNTARCVTSEISFDTIKKTFQVARSWFLGKRRPDIANIGVFDIFSLDR